MESVDARPMSPIEIVPDDLLRSKPPTQEDSMREKNVDGNVCGKVGPYVLGERLGAGGMGEVFRAFDERLERPVALKQIRPEGVTETRARRFKREARAAARLNHPGIVKLHDIFSEDGSDWIVMELVEGKTLAETLQSGPMDVEKAIGLALELAQALNAAHSEGIVHRDLKTNNVLVTSEGRIKILDFGLAKQVLFQDGQSTFMTADGQVVGTAHAMSPEQAMGRKVDLRSDLFSLGSLYYEMVTGVSPFKGGNAIETLRNVCTLEPLPIAGRAPGFPEAFSELVERLLEKEPAHRQRTVAEVVAELQRIIDAPFEGSYKIGSPREEIDADTLGRVVTRPVSERRQITVLCCELIRKDDPSGSLDPETFCGVMTKFEEAAREVVEFFDGYMANIFGHRLVAYFGYPRAHEDDANRAAQAAFQLLDRLLLGVVDKDFTLRSGIHSGPSVLLTSLAQNQLMLGQTLDVSIQLQKKAAPGDVFVCGVVAQAISKNYRVESVNTLTIKDSVSWSEVFRIVEPKSDRERLRFEEPPETLVGRGRELEILLSCFERAERGNGQVVLVSGEAGIGKSRLVSNLKSLLLPDRADWVSIGGSALWENSSFKPIVEILPQILGLNPESTPLERLDQLSSYLERHNLAKKDAVEILAGLLSLPFEQRFTPLPVSPQKHRDRTLEVLVDIIESLALARPLVFHVEDLHWMDPSTLELLGLLVERGQSSSCLIVMSFRPQFSSPWKRSSHVSQISLARLRSDEAVLVVERVAKGLRLPNEVRDYIVSRADGIPLYIEELTKNILESDLLVEKNGSLQAAGSFHRFAAVPSTLKSSLASRLDRLGSAKEVAQLAAAIGREFNQRLLAAICSLDESDLELELGRLIGAGLLFSKGLSLKKRFVFKHALVQEAAYEGLLERQKRDVHTEIATVLKESYPKTNELQPELIAHHYTRGGAKSEAVPYWLKAGQVGVTRSAYREAVEHLRMGLDLNESLPDGSETVLAERSLRTALAQALMSLQGISSEEVRVVHDQLRSVCQGSENTPDLRYAMTVLQMYNMASGLLPQAWEDALKLYELADAEGDMDMVITAKAELGSIAFMRGDLRLAYSLQESAHRLDPIGRTKPIFLTPHDPGVENRGNSSLALWLLGFPETALARCEESLSLALAIENPFSEALGLFFLPWLGRLCRNDREVEVQAERSIHFAEENEIRMWLPLSKCLYGWAKATGIVSGREKGPSNDKEGGVRYWVKYIHEAVSEYRSFGARLTLPFHLTGIAEVCIAIGDFQEAEDALLEALQEISSGCDRFWEAEIFRLQAKIVLAEDAPMSTARAIEFYEKAVHVARQQRAKSLELRATVDLCRLLKKTHGANRAFSRLNEIYSRFTEGFDTADLVEARRLLKSLRS